ncbi:MAG: Gfo/Idh/MocA family oxidoreductase [Opitutales bacterium]|nr:Gfo/Idh/MocA family oxidoreductase [Opitutales bacterium]
MRVGIIGLGFMGGMHFNAWQQVEGARVAAVCTRSPVTEQAKQGNIAGDSDQLNLDGVAIYTDLAEMLAQENLDAVSITLPTYLHKDVSIQCLQAGVHVLCEKPMALNVKDCQAMTDAAMTAGKQLVIAHCIRFWPQYAWLKQVVDAKTYGNVLVAEFERLTYAPKWSTWLADTEKSGGIALDLHIHDLDFIQYVFGTPQAIRSEQSRNENGAPMHVQSSLDYGEDLTVSATASWQMPESFGFKMAFRIVFDSATVIFDSQTLKVIPAEGDSFEPEIPAGDGYSAEVKYFAECISGTTTQEIITPAQATESVRMALETV